MSKQALKRVRKAIGLPVCREPLPAFAWPGGYPLVYYVGGSVCLCPACANADVLELDRLAGERTELLVDTHDEGEPIICDDCGTGIESAYGPVDAA